MEHLATWYKRTFVVCRKREWKPTFRCHQWVLNRSVWLSRFSCRQVLKLCCKRNKKEKGETSTWKCLIFRTYSACKIISYYLKSKSKLGVAIRTIASWVSAFSDRDLACLITNSGQRWWWPRFLKPSSLRYLLPFCVFKYFSFLRVRVPVCLLFEYVKERKEARREWR